VASANVELVRSIYAAWERGDYSSVEWADPEIEYVIDDPLSPGSWTGLADMAKGWRDWLSAWEDFRAEAHEYRELDENRVVLLTDFTGRGRVSGVEVGKVRTQGAGLFHLHGGKVTRLVLYFNRDQGLDDLGLAPEGPP
jgi:ketosteroid isomerase-like protein